MSARRKARELVLKCLYARDSTEESPQSIFESLKADARLGEKPLAFAHDLFFLILKNVSQIDFEIGRHAENWDISRVAAIDKNIMRIAICELLFMPDIPFRVSIDEAIELAKKYSTGESSAFVNGILNAIFKAHEAELEA